MVDRFWDFLLLTGKMFDWNSFGLAEKTARDDRGRGPVGFCSQLNIVPSGLSATASGGLKDSQHKTFRFACLD
jgi:hypothetical protein